MHKENIYDNKNEDEEIFPDEIEDITIHKFKAGKVYNINLYRLNIANITISNLDNKKYKYLVHFYPLECNIHLSDSKYYQTINISNYNYDAFYLISKKKYKYITFFAKPLIYSLSGELKNISCPLIINSVIINDNKIPELELNEKDPTLFHFNDDVPSLNLTYNYNNNNGNPIIVSFFNKEKARFRIEFNEGEEKINKIIYYKETILIKPNSQNTKYNILVKRIDQVNSTMIIKISGNIISPFYLQKNILNLGFIPKKEKYQYYYMKVYKRQEGEITLNNKRLNGLLISKIIYKNETENISNITLFPEYNKAKVSNDYLQFDEYNKKITFNSTSTKDCEDNCYLLITYYCDQLINLNIDGNEYTLLARVWDEEDFISQIVNIPLNEFIFGFIDNTTINIHYYSVYIPEDTEDITIEIHGENIISYAKKGIKKINTFKITNNTKILNKNIKEKIIINLNRDELDLDSYKGQYISFAFKKEDDDIQFSYYYFRILQPNNNMDNIIMYPLDTNKDMLCETKFINENNACYFLLKNEYNNLLNNFIFYGSGQEKIYYEIYCLNISDNNSLHFELNKNYKSEHEYIIYKDGCEDSMFAAIKIISNYSENISFISNFYESVQLDQKFDIYSCQLFYLNKNTNISFEPNQNILYKYRAFINNIGGSGNLIFNYSNGKNDTIIFNGKKSYSFSINNEINNIYFSTQQSLVYNIKINYQMKYEFMNELVYKYNIIDIANKANKGTFPIIYYIKDIKYGGMDINLYFKMNNENSYNNDFIIKGGVIDYKDFKEIQSEKDVEKNLHSLIDGIYEPEKYSGLIVFDKELSEQNKGEDKKHDDEYSFIIIDKKDKTNNNISDFTLEINVIPKNDNKTFLMINKYTQSSFKLLNNTSEFPNYFIEKNVIENNIFYIELSSNYEKTYLEFNNEIEILEEKKIGGVKQYYLLISNENENNNNIFFSVKVNRSGIIKYPKFRVTFSLIYYLEEKKFDVENIINKSYSYEFNNIKENLKGKIHLKIKNNSQENKDQNSSIAYYYYLRYINQNNILENENLNTISPIFSDLNSINITNASDINQETSYSFECKIEQNYLGSLLIKLVNGSEEEKYERYYSIPINFSTNETFIEKNKIVILIIASLSIIIIFGSIFFCVIWRRIKRKNINLEDKVKAISFSEGIEEDSSSQNLQNKSDDEYENTFI